MADFDLVKTQKLCKYCFKGLVNTYSELKFLKARAEGSRWALLLDLCVGGDD